MTILYQQSANRLGYCGLHQIVLVSSFQGQSAQWSCTYLQAFELNLQNTSKNLKRNPFYSSYKNTEIIKAASRNQAFYLLIKLFQYFGFPVQVELLNLVPRGGVPRWQYEVEDKSLHLFLHSMMGWHPREA